MGDLVVRGGTLLVDGGWQPGDLACRGDTVVGADQVPAGAPVLDATGLLVVPGFVDLQCNGALGIDLAAEPERLWELAAALPRFGVTAWLPTIVTTPDGVIGRALAALAAGPPEGWQGAVPVGLHLEGPFLSPATRGAHAADLLRAPTLAAIEGWSRARAWPWSRWLPTVRGRWPSSRRSCSGASSYRWGTRPPPLTRCEPPWQPGHRG